MFLHTFLFVFMAEMADKTQLMMVALTSRYRMKSVLLGMVAGVFSISALSVLAGDLIGDIIPMKVIKCAAAIMFLGFGLINLKKAKEGEEGKHFALRIPILSIALTFMLAELGDKTQLATVALAADHMQSHVAVFLGASLGLIMANIVGIFAGKFLLSKISDDMMKVCSSFFFFLFGSMTLFEVLPAHNFIFVVYSICLISIAYMIYMHSRKQQNRRQSRQL